MEQTTIFIHRTYEHLNDKPDSNYRIVTFINGNKDIINILKKIIKENYQNT